MNGKIFHMAACLVLLAGCASSGARIDTARLTEVRKGQTTVAEIVNKFGRPNVLSKNWDGTQTAVYASGEEGTGAAGALPLLGVLAAGGGSDAVVFYFDTRGVLTDYRTSQGAGISTAAPAQTHTNAPASVQPNAGGLTQSAGATTATPRSTPAAPARKSSDGLPFWLPSDKDPRQQ